MASHSSWNMSQTLNIHKSITYSSKGEAYEKNTCLKPSIGVWVWHGMTSICPCFPQPFTKPGCCRAYRGIGDMAGIRSACGGHLCVSSYWVGIHIFPPQKFQFSTIQAVRVLTSMSFLIIFGRILLLNYGGWLHLPCHCTSPKFMNEFHHNLGVINIINHFSTSTLNSHILIGIFPPLFGKPWFNEGRLVVSWLVFAEPGGGNGAGFCALGDGVGWTKLTQRLGTYTPEV